MKELLAFPMSRKLISAFLTLVILFAGFPQLWMTPIGTSAGNGLADVQAASSAPIYNYDGDTFSGVRSNPQPLSNPVATTYTNWPDGFNVKDWNFANGIFDGKYIWLIPHTSDTIVKMDTTTGTMSEVPITLDGYDTLSGKFSMGAFDGTNIWLFPNSYLSFPEKRGLVKINATTGVATATNSLKYLSTAGGQYFCTGMFDGTYLWLFPSDGESIFRVLPGTIEITEYANWPSGVSAKTGSKFNSVAFDGTYYWLIPFGADRLVRFNPTNGEMTGFNNWPSGFTYSTSKFVNSVFDGRYIWMIPMTGNVMVKFDTQTNEMSTFSDWPAGVTVGDYAFYRGMFDGANIWLIPGYNANLIRINPTTNVATAFSRSSVFGDADKFTGITSGVWDNSSNLWLISGEKNKLFKVSSGPSANNAPTDMSLSNASIAEESASGTTIGTLSATDADVGDTAIYSLVNGAGDTDNASFTISGATLKSAAEFDYETKSSYSIRVAVTDGEGAKYEETFTITVSDVIENQAPTDISLSNATIAEDATIGTTVGSLSAIDPDTGDTLTYKLVSGIDGADNASFSIDGNNLKVAKALNYEVKSQLSVKIEVSDGNAVYEEVFTIIVTNTIETNFKDVNPTAWFSQPVEYLSERSIINGDGSGTFKPLNNLTRAEFLAMVVRAYGIAPTSSDSLNFKDVTNTSAWYYDAVLKAYRAKLIYGFADGTFKPNDAITREQAMVILRRAISYNEIILPSGGPELKTFSDYQQVNSYSVSPVTDIVKAKIVSGTNGQLRPANFMTRAEGAMMLYNALTLPLEDK